jgi:hypothetical protein
MNSETDEVPKVDDSSSATEVKRLSSQYFAGASDGLESTDMLNQFKPGLYVSTDSDANSKQTASEGEPTASTPSVEPRLGRHRTSEAGEASQVNVENNLNSSALDGQIASSLEEMNVAEPTVKEVEAQLRSGTSQLFDFVAEGMDAADAIFDPIPEDDNEEVADEDDLYQPKLTPESVEAVTHAEAENVISRTILKKQTTDREEKSSDSEKDEEDDEVAPRNWLNFFKEFRGESGMKTKGKLIRRDRAFYQTSNKMNITCTVEEGDFETRCGYWLILLSDWFDTFLNYGTSYIIFVLIVVYTITIVLFAGFYYAIAQECDSSQAMTFSQAFAFSLETATTVSFLFAYY